MNEILMYSKTLSRIQEKIKNQHYRITQHAYEEMMNDGFKESDMIHGILSGRIVARQKGDQTGGWKWVIHGKAKDHRKIGVVVKEVSDVIIITIFEEF
ncbi:DUF4258 domain-containing protein [Deltaproteobacteria bacterium TL4]